MLKVFSVIMYMFVKNNCFGGTIKKLVKYLDGKWLEDGHFQYIITAVEQFFSSLAWNSSCLS